MIAKSVVVRNGKIDSDGKTTQANLLSENLFKDLTERRSRTERRWFVFDVHIPERRSGEDRRSRFDRRSAPLKYMGDKERRRIFQ